MHRRHDRHEAEEEFEFETPHRRGRARMSPITVSMILLAVIAVIAIAAVVVSNHPDWIARALSR